MCVIAIAVKQELPLLVLRQCESSNRDGGGCSWVERGLVHFKKNLTAAEIHHLLKDKPLPHVVHFRIGTVGGVKPSRCHPFTVRTVNNDPLAGVAKTVLFHNGHANGWEFWATMAGVSVPGDASDSQVIARIVAHRGEEVLQEMVSRGAGKFAVMHSDGTVKLYGGFAERDGYTFSNLHWAHGRSCNPTHDHGFKSHGKATAGSIVPSWKPVKQSWWEQELGIDRESN